MNKIQIGCVTVATNLIILVLYSYKLVERIMAHFRCMFLNFAQLKLKRIQQYDFDVWDLNFGLVIVMLINRPSETLLTYSAYNWTSN